MLTKPYFFSNLKIMVRSFFSPESSKRRGNQDTGEGITRREFLKEVAEWAKRLGALYAVQALSPILQACSTTANLLNVEKQKNLGPLNSPLSELLQNSTVYRVKK